ncbi:uncharacterized protein LOC111259951 isoform X2 [Varroa jacobsoni]|uniref:uncharacterized protein LOC111259951 isoform X2 n=1 Tax=Varroa jacobsoni TaxID=62625 RepID=UPI000BF2AC33|nr:uncharacterized protein LOC111259951 isoform X2 [Varroa jacobsoni]
MCLSGLGKFSNNSARIIESISPPSGSRSPEDAIRRSPSVESITSIGPRPVFLGPAKKNGPVNNRRGSKNGENKKQHEGEHHQQQADSAGTPRPDDDIVSFFERSWRDVKDALAQNIPEGHPEAQQKSAARRTVVHYRPASPSILTDFVPCNYEHVWADHQYRKLIKHIDLTIQRSQNMQEGKSF